ncbi:FAD synthase [uncultured archaeon]|nr:FAD synthase [uncultured archaeon]
MGLDKIKTLEELVDITRELKNNGKTIVHCHGCFDITHLGHDRHFTEAKKQGDVLIVTLTPDKYIQKGPGRPFCDEAKRLEHLSYLEFVDYVALNKWPTAIETIKLIQPNIYAKGMEVLANKEIDEMDGDRKKVSNLELEEEAVKSIGGKLYLTDGFTMSSSRIINEITDAISDESREFIRKMKTDYGVGNILNLIKSLKEIRPLVIGDAILDRYDFCQAMDKSAKEPIVGYKLLSSETHLGGVFAVANHTAGFTDSLDLVTCIGKNDHDTINGSLSKNIKRNISVQKESETLVKKRYIEQYKGIKLFELYNVDGLVLSAENEKNTIEYLEKNKSNFDMVIASDFGHGMISQNLANYLSGCGKFLAVNSQLNSGNFGYNFITKYPRADFVSLNDREIRLPFQERSNGIEVPIKKLSNELELNKINITLGKRGSVYYTNGNYFHSPAFIKEPLDTIGSGDALFSLTSLLAYKDTDPELLTFLGNCIGGLATRIIGNRRAVDVTELKKFVSYIMK